ncbi:hypothetical protein [Riemerella anatipestifer]|uniref:hypothetical protein n=1 Tax=Riemerella anatipestifer TaxID=34085 RepID=UPI002265ABFF|nr:hypothetical protein [Riemerella anatipestifer]UZX28279.1 hypothetical protein OIS45_02470 [Riemerella anatipestifer]
MKIKNVLLPVAALVLFSCNTDKNKVTETATNDSVSTTEQISVTDSLATETDENLALRVKNYLNKSFLTKEDAKVITPEDKKFSLAQVDLNNDGKNEVFVYLNSSYFCGSSGCTVLLLQNDLKPITTFTVTRPPFWVQSKEENGWKVLSVQDRKGWKTLTFNNGTYPSNPSLLDVSQEPNKVEATEVLSETNTKEYTF